jgi:hypothetical protein
MGREESFPFPFGGLAVFVWLTLDPWLCVAGFHRFCLFGKFLRVFYAGFIIAIIFGYSMV